MKGTPKRLVIALALACGLAVAGEEETWVAEDGRRIELDGAHKMVFIADEGGESFDLAELRDGETRTFGQGAKQITAQRAGDVVTLTRSAESGGKALEIQCTMPKDSCRIMTFADEPEKVMVMVEKRRECINGVGDCDATVDVTVDHLASGEGKVHAIVRKVECDDAGNCSEIEKVIGHPGSEAIHFVGAGAGPAADVMILRSEGLEGGPVLLRCPEGDATLHVTEEEAAETFLCPKHSVPLEQVGAGPVIRRIRVHEED
jgi:hypothetical protein